MANDTIEQENSYMPESDISEWKWSWRDEYLKWIAAFAYTDGGSINIGVNDDGYVVGLKNFRELLENIPNKIRDKLHITPKVRLHHVDYRGANIRYPNGIPDDIAAKAINRYACGTFVPANDKEKELLRRWENEIPVSMDPDGRYYYLEIEVEHYQTLVTYDGVVYSRSGSTLQILDGQELERAVLKSTGLSWDAFESAEKTIYDLDHAAIDLFRKKAVDRKRLTPDDVEVSDDTLLGKLQLLTSTGKPTRAAMMLFSDPEKIVPGAYIKIGFFAPDGSRGENTINDVIYHDDVHGPLLAQADKVMEYLYSKYLKALISYNGIQRVENYMIPQDAMREILLNAIAHKYYPSGNPIQVKVYDDHITVMNEGFWPVENIKVEDIYTSDHNSYRNNPLIAEGLYMAGEIETWGSGFNKIRKACQRYGTPLPAVNVSKGSVTIYIKPSDTYLDIYRGLKKSAESAEKSADYPEGLKTRHKQILTVMETGKEYSAEAVGELIGLQGSRTRQLLKELIELGYLYSTGDTKGRKYIKK